MSIDKNAISYVKIVLLGELFYRIIMILVNNFFYQIIKKKKKNYLRSFSLYNLIKLVLSIWKTKNYEYLQMIVKNKTLDNEYIFPLKLKKKLGINYRWNKVVPRETRFRGVLIYIINTYLPVKFVGYYREIENFQRNYNCKIFCVNGTC